MGQPTEGAIIAVGLKVNVFLPCFVVTFFHIGRVAGNTFTRFANIYAIEI